MSQLAVLRSKEPVFFERTQLAALVSSFLAAWVGQVGGGGALLI